MLTSHSLVECDMLCDTVAIMVKGRVICTGSPAVLRDKYGSGYRVNIKTTKDTNIENIHQYMNSAMEGATFIESKQNWIKYTVQGKISTLLGLLVSAKTQNIIDGFTLDVTSLEDIFLQITSLTNPALELISDQEQVLDPAWTSDEDLEEGDIPKPANYKPPIV